MSKHILIRYIYFLFVTIFLFIGFFVHAWDVALILIVVVTVMYILLLSLGSFLIQWNYYLPAINAVATDSKLIAITFDDGPHPTNTEKILDILKAKNFKATFFCIGKNAIKYPELVRRIQGEGHQLGSHTYAHSYFFDFLGYSGMKLEIQKGAETVEKITGNSIKLFRPPYGVTNPIMARIVREMDLMVIGWNVRSLDTVIKDKAKVMKRIKNKIETSNILLFHDTCEGIELLLSMVIEEMEHKNLQSVTINDLITNAKN